MSEQKTSQEHIAIIEDRGAHNYAPLPVVLSEGSGVWVTDVEGRRYIDMLSAYSALNFGHSNPRLVAVAERQMRTLALTSRAFYHAQMAAFCQALGALTGKQAVLPMNTGAEGVETAIKLARKWGYEVKGVEEDRAEIVVFRGNFHGRTLAAISASDSPKARTGFGPFAPGFVLADYGDVESLERAVNKNTVGVLIEPIQGEGGVIIPPARYLTKVGEICAAQNVLLIADEIQTGLCRTGEVFACDHERVAPDVYIIGKSLGGGILPVSAVAANKSVMDVMTPGTHGSTFGGNPVACAVAAEVAALIQEERPHERARDLGAYFSAELTALVGPTVQAVRAKGLMIGVDINPEAGTAKDFCEKLLAEGILCKDTREQTIRFTPPLTIERGDLEWALPKIRSVLG